MTKRKLINTGTKRYIRFKDYTILSFEVTKEQQEFYYNLMKLKGLE